MRTTRHVTIATDKKGQNPEVEIFYGFHINSFSIKNLFAIKKPVKYRCKLLCWI